MCLINFHYHSHPNYKLIVAANRDEFYDRPTANAHFWEDYPQILAGRDLEKHGTWLGITKYGRFAALTNYRDSAQMHNNENSRGEIVLEYLTGNLSPDDYIEVLKQKKELYNGYNLLIGNPNRLVYFNNIEVIMHKVKRGTQGLSNHFLNTPWPKVMKGKMMLQNYVTSQETIEPEMLFHILLNDEIAEDELLPHTGIELELERQLSPLFINTNGYGTRCSTVILITKNHDVIFVERTYHKGKFVSEQRFSFKIQSSIE